MPDYFYDMDLVVDPLNPSNVVAMGQVAIYDPADTAGTTLLALKDPSGLPLPNPLTSNANGFLPPRIATVPQTLWKSGGFEGYFNSFKGLRDEAVAAKVAAQDAGATAAAAATNDLEARIAAGQFKGDKGADGVNGQNGANVLPTDTAIHDAITTPGTQTEAALLEAIANTTASKLDVLGALEAVPFVAYGDSYGHGSQGSDQVSRPFNRLAVRHRTQALTLRAVAGTRMDEIATAIKTSWVPNGRGLVGIADGVLNDEQQYRASPSPATTREAFRSALAYLTARAVNDTTTAAFSFSAGWTGGTTSTVDSYANFAFTGATGYLLVDFVTGAGGTLTIRNIAGTTVATVSTGGYRNNFTGAVKLPGNVLAPITYRATLTTGSVNIVGVAATSPTPPVILWDKPAQPTSSAAAYALIKVYLDECATILPDFPTVVQVDMGAGWDYTTMISEDALHRNDAGNLHAANRISTELATFLAGGLKQGLNRLNQGTGAATAYTIPVPNFSITYSADSFNRANNTSVGTTETGAYAWSSAYPAGWVISGNALVASATVATVPPNDMLVNDGQANGTLSLTRVSNSSGSGIAFRVSADGSSGFLLFRNGANYTLARRSTNTSYATLATSTGITPNVNDVLTVVMNGSSIKARINGAQFADVTDAANTANTRHGAWTNSNVASSFDTWSHTDAV